MAPDILVTGGSGIVGSAVLRRLHDLGYRDITATYTCHPESIPGDLRSSVRWLPLELPDRQAALEVAAGRTWIIHTAGLISYRRRDKARLLRINRSGTADMIDAALVHDVRHFVFVGSIAALGKDPEQPVLDETGGWIDGPYATAYGLSKYLGELEAWRGAAEGLPVSVVLPSIVLGEGSADRSSMQLLHMAGRNPLWAPAGETGFVDARDVADFICLLLRREKTGERWLLSAGQLPYADLLVRLSKIAGLQQRCLVPPFELALLYYSWIKGLWGARISPEMIRQVYASFRFDNAKSLGIGEFRYRSLDETIHDLAPCLAARP